MKEGIVLVQITKLERKELLKKGCRIADDIHKTYTRYPHYFLTESARNLKYLAEIREKAKVG